MKVSFACSSFLKIREYETVASQPLSLPPFSPSLYILGQTINVTDFLGILCDFTHVEDRNYRGYRNYRTLFLCLILTSLRCPYGMVVL